MEKTVGKANKGIDGENPVNPEEKWIRLQEIGLSLILAIPVALMLGVMLQLHGVFLGMITLALGSGGYCCFKHGHEKRKEIAQNTHNEQSP